MAGYRPQSIHDPEFFSWAYAQTDAMIVTPFFDKHLRLVERRLCPICCIPGQPSHILWPDEKGSPGA